MKHFLIYFFAIAIGVGTTGCGRKLAPVSSSEVIEQKSDSTSLTEKVSKTDSSYTETVSEKTLPGATVEATFTREELGNITETLKDLPKQAQVIYLTDPLLKARLAFTLDSLGNLKVSCEALQQKYFEKTIRERTAHFEQTMTIVKLRQENRQLRALVFEYQKTPWEKFTSWVERFTFHICIGGAIAIGLLLLWKSIRSTLGSKIKIF